MSKIILRNRLFLCRKRLRSKNIFFHQAKMIAFSRIVLIFSWTDIFSITKTNIA
jgi:hypothetical protein